MACADPAKIRNLGIIAHIDAGKTTLSERILFYCRKIHKMGEVHDGAATMDFMPEEQERGITIASACTTCHWGETQINLVDTPGHVDFTMEVERCLRVLDGAVGVFCAVAGVEPQSETVWRQAENFAIPRLAFINKMDRPGASFENALQSIRERLNANAVPVVAPIGEGDSFSGIIDLVSMEKLVFDQADQGREVIRSALSAEEAAFASSWRDQLLEKLAEADDGFLALWLEGDFTEGDVRAALARATASLAIVPAYCGSALRNTGIQPLLDGIAAYLPPPASLQTGGIRPDQPELPEKGKPALGLVFKVLMEASRKNCFIRLYQGMIREGDVLINGRTGKPERIGRISRINADRREPLEALCAGDIGIITGSRDGQTGDTLREKGLDALLEPIHVYAPVITLALEPANADEGKILDEALQRYLQEDPTLRLSLDEETGMRMLSGMGELHLEVTLERLAREYRIRPRSGQPQAVLRESIKKSATGTALFDREIGRERHQGEVSVLLEPGPRGSGNSMVLGDFLPSDPQEQRKIMPLPFIQAVQEGVADSLQNGVSGWPAQDVHATITAIGKTDGLTTIPGLRMAASLAVRDALEKAGTIELEPIMKVEITTPEGFLGPVINLFNQCGGRIQDMDDSGGIKRLSGQAPLRKLFGFSTSLRSVSQGRAGFMLSFLKFDQA